MNDLESLNTSKTEHTLNDLKHFQYKTSVELSTQYFNESLNTLHTYTDRCL